MMSMFARRGYRLLRRIRPAPLQVLLLSLLGLNRRRVIELEDFRFLADPTSDFGTRLLQGSYEADLSGLIRNFLGPGQKFLDIGANEGFFSILASRIVGSTGEIIAIEPQGRLVPIIQKNLALNDCFNCRVLQIALGESDGEITMHLAPTTNTGSTSVYKVAKYPVSKEIVRCFSLEHVIERLGVDEFDLVKVDIEGAEYGVLLSADELLCSGRIKRIALELHRDILENQGLDPDELHVHLLGCGYFLEVEGPVQIYTFKDNPAR